MDEPKVLVSNTNRYLRLIQRFHPQVPVHLHTDTFGVDLKLVF